MSKLVKPALLDFDSGVTDDMSEGKTSLKSSMKRRGVEAIKQVIRGGGAGRKRKRVKRLKI